MIKKIIKIYAFGIIAMAGVFVAYAFSHTSGIEQDPDCLDKTEFPETFCPNCGEYSTFFAGNYGCEPEFIDMKIYNMNGEEIYASQDINFKWDGKNKEGKYLGSGSFYYTVQVLKGPMGITRQGYTQLIESNCLDNVKIAEEFSPNGDGLSDEFRIIFRCPPDSFTIKIFDNSGKIAYQSKDPDFKWNGQDATGNTLKQGSYDYIVNYTFVGKKKEIKGSLKLTR